MIVYFSSMVRLWLWGLQRVSSLENHMTSNLSGTKICVAGTVNVVTVKDGVMVLIQRVA